MADKKYLTIDNRRVEIKNERNLLEIIRRTGIDLPTFCYHSELSIYGACRLCVVEIEGMGIVTSCSTTPQEGMVVSTNTNELREMRKVYLKLLLANHHQTCTTCSKSGACRLQDLSNRLGIREIPFSEEYKPKPVDSSSPSLIRDPNKCVLCGDCVRACEEIQSVGAIDFANRGADTIVSPAFLKNLDAVECVYCGMCAGVCPTGSITPKFETEKVWNALNDKKKTVAVQIAPAIRVAIGEMFGLEPGEVSTGRLVAAMKLLGFDQVYDTSFAADLTVLEESTEFIDRKTKGEKLPLFTSCCPAWVKFAEQFYPDLLGNLSSCRSPQQMFGSVARKTLPEQLNVKNEDLYLVSIMPCTAKKFEAQRDEFKTDGHRDVDVVLTTQELGMMIKEAGIDFSGLTPESLDMPMGFKTGAGVIFGVTGGVSEAVLRFAAEKLTGKKVAETDYNQVRGNEDIRETEIEIGDIKLKLAVVHGLKNARKVAEMIRAGECDYDFVEVMSCPGGCIAGAGQPFSKDYNYKQKRQNGLYVSDKGLQLHKSQDNPYLQSCYADALGGEPGSHTAHELLHTKYKTRRRIESDHIEIGSEDEAKISVNVCVGTSCHLRGSRKILQDMMDYVHQKDLEDKVNIQATFCFEKCDKGPNVRIDDKIISKCDSAKAVEELNNALAEVSSKK
ncbi:NADP-reducing hydrogenase subunit HndC [Sedimentisphaera cyanobacteriorum]|uniref:NADP-reducing hydrogenase subunit HndC n=1 Tax=Sedimentisphaera cyanobacteriorum TaxID=1940790 RepID=A0A1Q2HPX2_9BACT|nr:NADH-dependent [FeFe] hydrogenase, group A6 [Sedimentisphaera cyanobacteriorum]AQQ09478.1 NADP-reducing hydrogenase subunit HndC [Sedimentisphaera cyanobacteriorum]